MLVGLGNGNDVHETSRVGLVRSDLSVNPAVMFLHQPSSLTTRTCWVFRVTSSSDEEGGEGFLFVLCLAGVFLSSGDLRIPPLKGPLGVSLRYYHDSSPQVLLGARMNS